MVVVANVDNGGGSLLLGRMVGRWAVASLRSVPPSFASPRPPRHLSLSLPPSLAPVLRLSRPFLRSQGKTLKSQQWSQREMGKKGRGMEHRGFRMTRKEHKRIFLRKRQKTASSSTARRLVKLEILATGEKVMPQWHGCYINTWLEKREEEGMATAAARHRMWRL